MNVAREATNTQNCYQCVYFSDMSSVNVFWGKLELGCFFRHTLYTKMKCFSSKKQTLLCNITTLSSVLLSCFLFPQPVKSGGCLSRTWFCWRLNGSVSFLLSPSVLAQDGRFQQSGDSTQSAGLLRLIAFHQLASYYVYECFCPVSWDICSELASYK